MAGDGREKRDIRVVVGETNEIDARKVVEINCRVRLSGTGDLGRTGCLGGAWLRNTDMDWYYPWTEMNMVTRM